MEREVSRAAGTKTKGDTNPGPSRERSRVVVHVVGALKVAHSKHARLGVESESPISNGLTTVAVIE